MTLLGFFNVTATTKIYTYRHTLSLHDALPICVERAATLELRAQAAEHRHVRDASGEERRRQQRPVERVVPDDLDRHHLRVAEQRVLVLEQRHGEIGRAHV